jgi:hypothetical protein
MICGLVHEGMWRVQRWNEIPQNYLNREVENLVTGVLVYVLSIGDATLAIKTSTQK